MTGYTAFRWYQGKALVEWLDKMLPKGWRQDLTDAQLRAVRRWESKDDKATESQLDAMLTRMNLPLQLWEVPAEVRNPDWPMEDETQTSQGGWVAGWR